MIVELPFGSQRGTGYRKPVDELMKNLNEGCIGCLSQRYNNEQGSMDINSKTLTSLQIFRLKRSDGKPVAEDLFGLVFPDYLIDWLTTC